MPKLLITAQVARWHEHYIDKGEATVVAICLCSVTRLHVCGTIHLLLLRMPTLHSALLQPPMATDHLYEVELS